MAKRRKNQPAPERHAAKDCACDKCWKPKPEDEAAAKKYWREAYARLGWPRDNHGYL